MYFANPQWQQGLIFAILKAAKGSNADLNILAKIKLCMFNSMRTLCWAAIWKAVIVFLWAPKLNQPLLIHFVKVSDWAGIKVCRYQSKTVEKNEKKGDNLMSEGQKIQATHTKILLSSIELTAPDYVMVGLDHLIGLFQPEWFYGSVISPAALLGMLWVCF